MTTITQSKVILLTYSLSQILSKSKYDNQSKAPRAQNEALNVNNLVRPKEKEEQLKQTNCL